MRKLFSILTALVVATLSVAVVTAQDTRTLTVWYHTYPPAIELLRQQADEWGAANGVNVEIIDYPHGDYEVRLLAALAAGTGPDVINLLDYKFPEYIERNLLAPISPSAFGVETAEQLASELYEPRALEGLSGPDGTVYGVPAENNTLALFLNKTMFEAAGLDATDPEVWPETWEELFDLAERLTVRDSAGNIEQIGFNWVWGLDVYWYAQQYWPILLQYGCQLLNEDQTESLINSPECVAAFEETWNRLITENLGGPEVATVNPVNALEDFSIGRQAMMIAGIWAPPAFRDNPAVYDNYVVAPLPQRDPENPITLMNAYALAVNNAITPEQQQLAWEFINYVTSDSQAWLETSGYITGRTEWWDFEGAENVRGLDIFRDGMQYGVYVWRSPVFTQQGTAIKEAIENFAYGGMTVQEALDIAKATIDSTLNR